MAFIHPSTDLRAKLLVVAVVSAGNVAQLAADLLIHSLALSKIAIVHPTYFIPVAGAREDGISGIVTPMELYGKQGSDIVIIQPRSPILKLRTDAFIIAFHDFLQSSQPAAVVFLSGMDLSTRTDAQMQHQIYRLTAPHCPALNITPLASLLRLPAFAENAVPTLPGAGITRRLMSAVSPDVRIPITALLLYVAEGDNTKDAYHFASVISNLLDLHVTQWKQPDSWREGLFGTAQDQTLYG